MKPKVFAFIRLRNADGNVVLELIFSITLMSAIALPAITSLATVINARDYATSASMQLARTWTISTVNERDLAVAQMQQSLIAQAPYPMTISTTCTPDCEAIGATVTVTSRIATGVAWIGRIAVRQSLEMNRYAP